LQKHNRARPDGSKPPPGQMASSFCDGSGTLGAMDQQPVDSRAIRSVAYNESERTLLIEFQNGSTYRYSDVPPSVYEWLLRAPNKGAYISRMISGQYPHERLDGRPHTPEDALVAALQASLKSGSEGESA
jgi:hypothetical protein